MMHITLRVNNETVSTKVSPNKTLLAFLREDMEMTGTKSGCEQGDCGACTVLLDGKAVNSCLVLAVQANGCCVTTIEGLSKEGELNEIQQAFIDNGAIQCGYCTPGMVLASKALHDANPDPTCEEIKKALSGNLCRCGNYNKIIQANKALCKKM